MFYRCIDLTSHCAKLIEQTLTFIPSPDKTIIWTCKSICHWHPIKYVHGIFCELLSGECVIVFHVIYLPIDVFADHYSDVIINAMASQITGFSIAYSIVCPGADESKHQSSASLAFVRGTHRWPLDSPHKAPVKRKMFPFDDVIIIIDMGNLARRSF